ncbi:phenylacetate-CoA ligase [Tamaricihabitans halophyticus]|uniref:Phenylacetate-CoA ligase n=1 Tax=Tamaricihabitans halophyticus TaxID=1262583 RepID=A0A4R2Q474_9PSEU|nr:AMP-binding protein [Tamaricihabitans halophyticus]TCP43390.1 phenylacetate-CoA ligase [Tamaricihabitans halophyticus]
MLLDDVAFPADTPVSFVEPDAETASPRRRRQLQERRLSGLIDRLLAADGVQAARLRDAGVSAGADVHLADLPKLPLLNRRDLLEHGSAGFYAVSMREVACVHGSSAQYGTPIRVPYTTTDVEIWAKVMARALGGAGTHTKSIIHNAYNYGLFTGGMGVHHGGLRIGANVLPAASGTPERQARLIINLRPDVLCCTPSHALALGAALHSAGVADSPLRVGLLGAEMWTDRQRLEIERILRIRAFDVYGLSEVIGPGVAAESIDSGGKLNIAEDHFYPEVIDESGAVLPPGVRGELVFTTLTKTGMPLLRYRTGDIATLFEPPDGAARTLRRMSRVVGRRSDLLSCGVFPSDVETVLLADGRVRPHYLLVEDRRGSTPELYVAVEPASAATNPADLGRDLAVLLRQQLDIRAQPRVYPHGELPRAATGKQLRLYRWSAGEPPIPGLT